jgi:tRNA pseudouridine55 synthase
MIAEEKEYRLVCRLGVETDTQDITGAVVRERDSQGIGLERVEEVLQGFRGTIQQVPPMVSAKRHKGKRLYDLARQGIEVERQPIEVTIHELELLEYKNPDIALRVFCSKGTYIRTLCHDIGGELECGAAMASLVRTRCGSLKVEDSIDSAELKDPDSVRKHLISADDALAKFPGITITDGEVSSWMTGRAIRGGGILSQTGEFEKDSVLRIKARDGRLIGLGKSLFSSGQLVRLGGDLEVLKPIRVFPKPFMP